LKVALALSLFFFNIISLFSQTPGSIKWEFESDGGNVSSAAINSEGTIYVCFETNGKLYAINHDGTKKWEFLTGGSIYSSPSIGNDGTIYVGSHDNKLYAINTDGTKKWEFITGGRISYSAAIGADGTIYVSSSDSKLYAIRPDGTKKWEYLTGWDQVTSSPAIAADGTVYIRNRLLIAIHPDGTKKWEHALGIPTSSSPAIGGDGTIYIGSNVGIFAINPDGTERWNFNAGQCRVESSPTIGTDGTIYFGGVDKLYGVTDGKLYAINPDGTKKWDYLTGQAIWSSSAIGADGTIYVGSDRLYALNSDGSKKWQSENGYVGQSSPTIGSDGTIYVKLAYSKLSAIYSTSNGLANSPWPKYKHDNFNTGQFTEGQFGDLVLLNNDFSNMVLPNQSYVYKINLYNTFLKNVTLTNVHFSETGFVLSTSMPVAVVPGIKKEISISLSTPQNRWYKPKISIDYTLDGVNYIKEANLEGIIFLNDNTELANTANRVIPVWKSLDKSNEVLLNNTKGIIYRLLSDYPAAEKCFNIAVSKAINDNYGYAGIMMNTGVVKSDRVIPDSAIYFYTNASNAIQSDAGTSVLAPQIYYNQAWEEFGKKNYPLASGLVLSTINHPKSNDYLKAKANTLLGAIKFSEEEYNEAKDAFNQAIILDSNGPIGEMARENLALTNSVGIEDIFGDPDVRVYPNPSAGELFISTDMIQGNCSISIFNITGEKVYSDEVNSTAFLPLRLDLSRLSDGVYYIQLILPDKVCIEKVIIKKK
jgi:outer membrane protein assembly factor BamB